MALAANRFAANENLTRLGMEQTVNQPENGAFAAATSKESPSTVGAGSFGY